MIIALSKQVEWEKRKRFPPVLMFMVQKFAPYNFKNFHAFKIERILQKTALVREVADVGEAVPSLTDAGGYLLNRK